MHLKICNHPCQQLHVFSHKNHKLSSDTKTVTVHGSISERSSLVDLKRQMLLVLPFHWPKEESGCFFIIRVFVFVLFWVFFSDSLLDSPGMPKINTLHSCAAVNRYDFLKANSEVVNVLVNCYYNWNHSLVSLQLYLIQLLCVKSLDGNDFRTKDCESMHGSKRLCCGRKVRVSVFGAQNILWSETRSVSSVAPSLSQIHSLQPAHQEEERVALARPLCNWLMVDNVNISSSQLQSLPLYEGDRILLLLPVSTRLVLSLVAQIYFYIPAAAPLLRNFLGKNPASQNKASHARSPPPPCSFRLRRK